MANKPLYFDDLHVGDSWTGSPILFTEEAIVRFGREFDPQPMHIDKAAAEAGRFGGLIASGWHILAAAMRDYVDADILGGTPMLGLGCDELRWVQPVRPGDVLTVRREIVAVDRSKSRPDRGSAKMKWIATNQDGDVVLSCFNSMQVPVKQG